MSSTNPELDLIVEEVKSLIDKGVQEEEVMHYVASKDLPVIKMIYIVCNAYRVGIREAEVKLSQVKGLKRKVHEFRKFNNEFFHEVFKQLKEDESGEWSFEAP
ncbi:hypothetical protein [Lacunimicrobium album]